ncbi:oligosaccharide flippase family protein [Aquimarina sp. W85]|uniref:oligosaccharide flippase family protein n=1 Tax=Aquimarina rhodophyticola TaxID=3342246 RepID=UPI0036710249
MPIAIIKKITEEQRFMLSCVLVNGGNYLYNLILGRILGPSQFADAAVLITFLLVLSFAAMTFQLATAKFSVLFDQTLLDNFINLIFKISLILGTIFGICIILFANELQELFNTQSSLLFTLFGLGVPIYFIMSVNRGLFQGKKKFNKLSLTYQSEMVSRLLITLALIYMLGITSPLPIVLGILASFVIGVFPLSKQKLFFRKKAKIDSVSKKMIRNFILLTAFYELTQILINNSDILMVKHYFDSHQAGLYASLALIGRVVYFVAWMLVMMLLPKVIQKQKDGEAHQGILLNYVFYISLLALTIIAVCYLFPNLVINLMFGSAYIEIAPLLWKYALATSLFAISNIFAYYFLSLDQYIPVILSGILGIAQIVLIVFYHESLTQVVLMQIVAMLVLLIVQLIFFLKYTTNQKII